MDEISWEIKVPIFRNRIILRQLGLAVGIPFGLLTVILIAVGGLAGLAVVGALLILSLIIIYLVFRGTYDVCYTVSKKGILCENKPDQARRVKKMSALTVLLAIFSRNPTAAGIGVSAGSKTREFYAWRKIRRVRYLDSQKCIMIHGGFAENTAVFCTEENYTVVKDFIAGKLNQKKR